jgi:hypothetical protein
MEFTTPRLLLEVRQNQVWEPRKIFCDYVSARGLIHALPKLAAEYQLKLCNMRVKHLRTQQEIAEAKLQVYRNEDRRRRNK